MDRFFEWLKANGFTYTRGDIHFAGSGYWFPQLPDITTGAESPTPPEPWIHIEQPHGEQAVFIEASFAKGSFYAESERDAKEHTVRLLMDYDMALRAEPFVALPYKTVEQQEQIVGRHMTLPPEYRDRIEREWEEREGPKRRARDAARAQEGGPLVSPPYKSNLDGFEDLGASDRGPAGRFVQDWVFGRLGSRKTKEAALSRSLDGPVDTLYSYAVPIASIFSRKFIVVSTREALARTSVTTNRHLSWVTHAAQGKGGDATSPHAWGGPPFPPPQFAFLTEGRIPTNAEEWASALVLFDNRNEGNPPRGPYHLRGDR